VESLSITYGYYQNETWYVGDWGHYFDMGMIIGRGGFFFQNFDIDTLHGAKK
jgi:hypothetical protein